jgi:hypothetical protein
VSLVHVARLLPESRNGTSLTLCARLVGLSRNFYHNHEMVQVDIMSAFGSPGPILELIGAMPHGVASAKTGFELCCACCVAFCEDFFTGWATLAYPFGRLHIRYFGPGDANHLYLVAHIKLLW